MLDPFRACAFLDALQVLGDLLVLLLTCQSYLFGRWFLWVISLFVPYFAGRRRVFFVFGIREELLIVPFLFVECIPVQL